ncbi:S8 family peptidase [Paraburkholderia sp. RL17-337-BIB-A]|uniref:S8 family peptidase n=1 Tax=Paraburkholderia sp. RL17-337-BIB-A TaxID=3031636 RepID=UPI0038BC9D3C
MAAGRFLIGRGELLTYDIPPPPIDPDKAHPYAFDDAMRHLMPQIATASAEFQNLPAEACPGDMAVAMIDLHPAYIAKSFFPSQFLREANLTSLGSRSVLVRPRKETRKTAPEVQTSTRLFVAGTRRSFARLPGVIGQLRDNSREALQFAEIEDFRAMTADDRIRTTHNGHETVFEAGLHLLPDQDVDVLQAAFSAYANLCGFEVNAEFVFPVGGMLFVAVQGRPAVALERLAKFSLLRVLRPMPILRSHRPVPKGSLVRVPFELPVVDPVSDEPKVAILDGGLPDQHGFDRFVRMYRESDPAASDVSEFLDHGMGVTSAFLFGPVEPGQEARRPYSYVDVYRVLDDGFKEEDPLELYRTLAHIEEVLLSRQYQFLNLSLGPELPIEDDDVHAWTAVLDTMLSDGGTLVTVAAGNNGELKPELGLNRIQVPADCVNALAVGAADKSQDEWARAPYSAQGPGRSPGIRKPDIVAFGGCPKEYFHVARPGKRRELTATMGTSFSAPYALRSAVGIRAILGEAIHPLTIKALLIHGAQTRDGHDAKDVGWGRIPEDIAAVITTGNGVARIIYQGFLRPGKYLRAPVPLPDGPLEGFVTLTATFCYACTVDVEDAAAYTKAGLTVTFRPNVERKTGRSAETKSFFSQKEFRTEQQQRADLGKWETVLHATRRMRGSSLNQAAFDIHYTARDGGGAAGAHAELIPYALVLTVHAPKHGELHSDILKAHHQLRAIEPRVSVPLRVQN